MLILEVINFLYNVFLSVKFLFIIFFVDFILGFNVVLIECSFVNENIGVFIYIFFFFGW